MTQEQTQDIALMRYSIIAPSSQDFRISIHPMRLSFVMLLPEASLHRMARQNTLHQLPLKNGTTITTKVALMP